MRSMLDLLFPNVPVQLIFLDLVSIAAVLGVGYYAARMFYHLRQGRLEKGWAMMLIGAGLVASGYFFLTVEDFFLAFSSFFINVDYLGTVICTAGLIVLMMGLRSHYVAWSLGKGPKKKAAQTGLDTERDKDALIDLK
jgi:hypothetical protein